MKLVERRGSYEWRGGELRMDSRAGSAEPKQYINLKREVIDIATKKPIADVKKGFDCKYAIEARKFATENGLKLCFINRDTSNKSTSNEFGIPSGTTYIYAVKPRKGCEPFFEDPNIIKDRSLFENKQL